MSFSSTSTRSRHGLGPDGGGCAFPSWLGLVLLELGRGNAAWRSRMYALAGGGWVRAGSFRWKSGSYDADRGQIGVMACVGVRRGPVRGKESDDQRRRARRRREKDGTMAMRICWPADAILGGLRGRASSEQQAMGRREWSSLRQRLGAPAAEVIVMGLSHRRVARLTRSSRTMLTPVTRPSVSCSSLALLVVLFPRLSP